MKSEIQTPPVPQPPSTQHQLGTEILVEFSIRKCFHIRTMADRFTCRYQRNFASDDFMNFLQEIIFFCRNFSLQIVKQIKSHKVGKLVGTSRQYRLADDFRFSSLGCLIMF